MSYYVGGAKDSVASEVSGLPSAFASALGSYTASGREDDQETNEDGATYMEFLVTWKGGYGSLLLDVVICLWLLVGRPSSNYSSISSTFLVALAGIAGKAGSVL